MLIIFNIQIFLSIILVIDILQNNFLPQVFQKCRRLSYNYFSPVTYGRTKIS